MEQNNQEDELRAQAIFNASVDGIITISDKGIIESMNPSSLVLFGYAADELIGKNINCLMPQPHRKQHDQYIDNYNTTGQKKIIDTGREVEGLRKDGTTFPFRLVVSEIKFKAKTIYTGFIHDLTEQKEAESTLLKLKEELEKKVEERTEDLAQVIEETQFVNQQLKEEVVRRKEVERELQKTLNKELELSELKSRFVSMASHEFRTPLTGILSSVELIGKYNSVDQKDKKQKHVERIRSSVLNLTNILNDFLSFDQLQAGKIKCQPKEFDFSTFIEELVDDTRQLKKQGQELLLTQHNERTSFNSDPHLLKNILLNLFSNAIKYSDEHQKIEVVSELKNSGLILKVIDEGIGIPKEEHIYLFDRFFRAKNASNIQGTGLGLNIVKQYIHVLGGTISFESEDGEGSTFTIQLPFYNS
tara:strand:+ start:1821 stop:3071 length:1251 start_codon:yes stop_codon:yes gene_type:complete